jgi:hypothetical protein
MIPYESPRKLAFMLSTCPRTTMRRAARQRLLRVGDDPIDRVGDGAEVRRPARWPARRRSRARCSASRSPASRRAGASRGCRASAASRCPGRCTGVCRSASIESTLYCGVWTATRYWTPFFGIEPEVRRDLAARAQRHERVVRDVPLREPLLARLARSTFRRSSGWFTTCARCTSTAPRTRAISLAQLCAIA